MEVSKKLKILFMSLCVILLYFVWPYFCSYVLSFLNIDKNLKLFLNLILNFICLASIIFIYVNDLKKDYKKFIKNFKSYMKKGLKYFIIGLLCYGIVNIIIAGVFDFSNISNDNLTTLENVFSDNIFMLFLSTVFYYPIVEELVFKKTFKDIIDNKWLFVFISAFANAFFTYAFSATNALSLIYIIPSTLFYMGLSYGYYATDNIMVPITYRIIYNLIPNIALLIETMLIIKFI